MENLIKAINNVMADCENVDKSLTVGTGRNSYKGVADKDVKLIINRSMRENGLAIFTTNIEPKITIERWQEDTQFGVKQKQSVFTEVITTYKMCHKSGESIEIQGYGHGVDSQDKSAGKATTYALKYTLLYQFLVATGSIDDADNTHSEQVNTPTPKPTPKPAAPTKKDIESAIASLKKAKDLKTLKDQWLKLSKALQDNKEVLAVKDMLKEQVS